MASPQSKFASFWRSFVLVDSPCWNLTPIFLLTAVIGARSIQIKDIYQLKTKPTRMPPNIEKFASIWGARLSVLVPLIIPVSSAMAVVKTLVPFARSSNHPMFFYRMFSYRTLLIWKVTFSPKCPKLLF